MNAQQREWLFAGVIGVAWKHGAIIGPSETVHALAVREMPSDGQSYWSGECGQFTGHLMHDEELREELRREHSVLVWTSKDDGIQRLVRVINTKRLNKPAEIAAYVAGPGTPGRYCRFCNLREPALPHGMPSQLVNELPPKSEQRVGAKPRTVPYLLHRQCAPYWEQWQKIAADYARAAG